MEKYEQIKSDILDFIKKFALCEKDEIDKIDIDCSRFLATIGLMNEEEKQKLKLEINHELFGEAGKGVKNMFCPP